MSSSDVTREGLEGVRPGREATTGANTGPGGSGPPARRWRKKHRAEAPMVPEATFTSYYGQPIINRPTWKAPDIPGYLFLGGLAGAGSVIAAGAQLSGRPGLARTMKSGCAAAAGLSLAALMHDLGRPARFLNMLRTFKPTSPMSIGSWLLSAYAPMSAAAALSDLTGIAPWALAIIKNPDIVEKIEQVYFIGGNYWFNDYAQMYGTGTTPLSEWNVLVDPEAARIVFRSGVPLTALGVDVWAQPGMNLTDSDLKELSESEHAEAELTHHFVQFVEGRGYQRYSALIDTLAVIAAVDSSVLHTHCVGVDVETDSPLTLGMTVVERRVYHAWKDLPKIRAAYSADFGRYREKLMQLILA